jgi:hypothetical protein
MQYELAKLIMPFVLLTGGYDSDDQSVEECRNIINTQEQANEKSRIDWMVDVMGGDSHRSDRTTIKRTAQTSSLSGVHHSNP